MENNIEEDIKVKRAIEELRGSYELKHRQWAYNCLDTIEKELETYKKIAKKLAKTMFNVDYPDGIYDVICKDIPEEKCEQFEYSNCYKCIIDWARNEVGK